MVSALRLINQSNELLTTELTQLLNGLMVKDWVVYAKSTLDKAHAVVGYLARYTHKAAISNSRIMHVDENNVRFHWKDYRDNQQKMMTLNGVEFIRRYLLHVLPKGFMRIRHFGFLANRCRRDKLACIRDTIVESEKKWESVQTKVKMPDPQTEISLKSQAECQCPKCRRGVLLMRFEVSPKRKRRTD